MVSVSVSLTCTFSVSHIASTDPPQRGCFGSCAQAPNRYQAISNHHTDSTLTIVSLELIVHICILDNSRWTRNPVFSFDISGPIFSRRYKALWSSMVSLQRYMMRSVVEMVLWIRDLVRKYLPPFPLLTGRNVPELGRYQNDDASSIPLWHPCMIIVVQWWLVIDMLTHWGRVKHICVGKLTMACRLDGAKPLSEPMLEYCQLNP